MITKLQEDQRKQSKQFRNLSSSPPLPEPNVELVVQQFLIVCPHINGYRQALCRKVHGNDFN